MLERRGFTQVTYLRGHMSGWKREGLPVETGDAAPSADASD
jgi:rhodanese-related sulfurtransferase